jgi:hypothetical protein
MAGVASHNTQGFSFIRCKPARDSSRNASLLVTGKTGSDWQGQNGQ